MNESPKEHLSALIDGELERDAARFLMKRLDGDAELRGAWERWQLAGACLRRQSAFVLPADFAERISSRIEHEPAPRSLRAGLLHWAAGLAVAASVAVVALVAVQPPAVPGGSEAGLAAMTPGADAVVATSPLRAEDLRPNLGGATQTVSASRTQLLGPALPSDPRLELYLMRHGAAQGGEGALQMLPYVQALPAAAPASLQPVAERR
jgi:negative regulator of sigma E activity